MRSIGGLDLILTRPGLFKERRLYLGKKPAALRAVAFMIRRLQQIRAAALEDCEPGEFDELLSAEAAIEDNELEGDTNDGELLMRRARFFQSGGQTRKALRIAHKLVEDNNNAFEARLFLLQRHCLNYDREKAEYYYKAIKREAPDHLEADAFMCTAWLFAGDERFIPMAEKIISRSNDYPGFHHFLISAYVEDGKADAAEDALNRYAARPLSPHETVEMRAGFLQETQARIAVLRAAPLEAH